LTILTIVDIIIHSRILEQYKILFRSFQFCNSVIDKSQYRPCSIVKKLLFTFFRRRDNEKIFPAEKIQVSLSGNEEILRAKTFPKYND